MKSIKIKDVEYLKPYLEPKIGDVVVYKNGCGGYYEAVTESVQEWQTSGSFQRLGVKCNFGDHVDVISKLKLFFYTYKEPVIENE